MACNGLYYGILTNYSDTYFLRRDEADLNTLYISHFFQPGDTIPTLCECVYYISQLAINDIVGDRLGYVILDNDSSSENNDNDNDSNHSDPDDPNDPDYLKPSNDNFSDDYDDTSYSRKRKRKQMTGKRASSSKMITTVGEYIGGRSFGQVFFRYYNNQAVA
ncbi:hypothetical protein RclHR1_07720010 [Rhizophagus clarus]|uniref:Uncharacterized protein n=1 Tax=Rhizophagus clarus TaxID=94130 RepID=A0A2Z6RXW8_9GLOM|nr:hypothetical protein RclHR1_07720010 [Rhizophagus clarus]